MGERADILTYAKIKVNRDFKGRITSYKCPYCPTTCRTMEGLAFHLKRFCEKKPKQEQTTLMDKSFERGVKANESMENLA